MLETRVISAVCMTLKDPFHKFFVKNTVVCVRLFYHGLDLACFQARRAQNTEGSTGWSLDLRQQDLDRMFYDMSVMFACLPHPKVDPTKA